MLSTCRSSAGIERPAPHFAEEARVAEQHFIAIICNQLARESDAAQPFSDFGVQLDRSSNASRGLDSGKVTDACGVPGFA
jgi:hypothetical protein